MHWLDHSSNQSRQQGASVHNNPPAVATFAAATALVAHAATAADTALKSLSEGTGKGGASRPAPLLSCRFLVGVRFGGSRGPPAGIIAAAAASRFRRACWMTRRRRQRSRYDDEEEEDVGTTTEEGMAMAASDCWLEWACRGGLGLSRPPFARSPRTPAHTHAQANAAPTCVVAWWWWWWWWW